MNIKLGYATKNEKGDVLISEDKSQLALFRVRAKDGQIRTSFLDEPLDDPVLECRIREFVHSWYTERSATPPGDGGRDRRGGA